MELGGSCSFIFLGGWGMEIEHISGFTGPVILRGHPSVRVSDERLLNSFIHSLEIQVN